MLLADCTAVAYANLHQDFVRGRAVAMACPKLDDTAGYAAKLAAMIRTAKLRSIEVVMMEVPCCAGLFAIAEQAVAEIGARVPLTKTVVNLEGEIVETVAA